MNASADLAYWICERESMRLRRIEMPDSKGPLFHGWSQDSAMGVPRYCNVRREDDKVTMWLAKHWRPEHHTYWELTLARMVNYIPSLEKIVARWQQHPTEDLIESAETTLKIERAAGNKIWTSAYTISTCGQSMDKVDYVMSVVTAVREREREKLLGWLPDDAVPKLENAFNSLTRVDGLGSFLAAQVIADAKNTQGHYLQKAEDWWEWCAPGPGSRRGLSWYYFGKPDVSIRDQNFYSLLKTAWSEVEPLLPDYVKPLHMQDFQNCLCEFSKYMRFKNGDRRIRNKYNPG